MEIFEAYGMNLFLWKLTVSEALINMAQLEQDLMFLANAWIFFFFLNL